MTPLPYAHDHYTLSTGRRFYANNGLVGMSPAFAAEGDRFAEGYDGEEYTRKPYDSYDMAEWTPAERQELADYMSALWQAWAGAQPAQQPSADEIAAESAARLAQANRVLQSR